MIFVTVEDFLPQTNFNAYRSYFTSLKNNKLSWNSYTTNKVCKNYEELTNSNISLLKDHIKVVADQYVNRIEEINHFIDEMKVNDFNKYIKEKENELKTLQNGLANYKNKFYKNIKSVLKARRDF